MVMIDRENTWYIVNFAIPIGHHVKEKEEEKIDKYMDLVAEVRRKFVVNSDCTDCFRSFGDSPSKTIRITQKIEDIIESLNTAVLISTTAILRRVLKL